MSGAIQAFLAALLTLAAIGAANATWSHWDGLETPRLETEKRQGRHADRGRQATPVGEIEGRNRADGSAGEAAIVDESGRELASVTVIAAAPAVDGPPALLLTLRIANPGQAPFAFDASRLVLRDRWGFLHDEADGRAGRDAARAVEIPSTPAVRRDADRAGATPAPRRPRDRTDHADVHGLMSTRPARANDAAMSPAATPVAADAEWTIDAGQTQERTVRIAVPPGTRIAQILYEPTPDQLVILIDVAG